MNSDNPLLQEEPPAYGGPARADHFAHYLRQLQQNLRRGDATEHTHRPALKTLLEASDEKIVATNEPRRSACGAPDYVVVRKRDGLTLGYIEAKDVGINLDEEERSEQLKRYLPALSNLLLTDYLEFRWFVDGKKRETFRLASLEPGGRLVPAPSDEFHRAQRLLAAFLSHRPVDIASAEELARRLATLAHVMRDIIIRAFQTGQASLQLRDWRNAFARTLLPELAPHADAEKESEAVSEFADMFAQTLAYGFFSARASSGVSKFTREKAQKLIPRTNPFLRIFFEQITGSALEEEPFAGFVEDLIQTLDHSDMGRILEDFGKRRRRRDPVVHFYETFLQAYDPKLRELRGVYYTPEPVVNYIVQSIDFVLKDKFSLKDGLADRSKIKVTRKDTVPQTEEEMHRVLILDPATGTATFLYTVLDFIRSQFKTRRNAGQWGSYVHDHLLPRLFGFELLMAPYAVAHFKLGLALAAFDEEPLFRPQWSYEPRAGERLNIFLTNTLEDLERASEQLGPLRALSDEANSAYEIKKHKPVLVVLGNPPYSGHSANRGEWMNGLVRDYHFCDGKPLGERNPKWLQNDYVKFLRWGQWRIEQTGQGILAFITSNSYLDSPTFRGMRQNLMRAFDEIYILDLHGNSKKKECVPGTNHPDKNVFDITEGVAIALFVKLPGPVKRRTDTKKPAQVRHCELWGAQRQQKYDWLDAHHIKNTNWTVLEPASPHYFFIPQNNKRQREYERGWKMTDMMPIKVLGFQSHRDHFALAYNYEELQIRMGIFRDHTVSDLEIGSRFKLADVGNWKISDARAKMQALQDWKREIIQVDYRPFDRRFCYYNTIAVDRPRPELVSHVARHDNLCLNLLRQTKSIAWRHVFAGTYPASAVFLEIKDGSSVFPLYLYPNGAVPSEDLFAHENGRRPNFSKEFIGDICEKLQVKFVPDGLGRPGRHEIGPELIFNYAYAIFHSPVYRERYAGYLRADFPRLPLTSQFELFRQLAGLGGELVDLHARDKTDARRVSFPVGGDNVIEEVRYQPPREKEPGRVWINDRQYFQGVGEEAWAFPIGGYLPAQRWLKDRIGRATNFEDQQHYMRLVHALAETRRLMAEIDNAIEQHGGWPLK